MPKAAREGPSPRMTMWVLALRLAPRMNPPIMTSLPVPTKARVLILASCESLRPDEVVNFHQAYTRGVIVAFHDRRIGAGSSVARMADSRSLVGGRPVAMIAVRLGSLSSCRW